jgi:hypothetical protein
MAPIKEVATVLAAEIEELDDNELFSMLREHNIPAGPIVASTRHLYQKKLIRLLSNQTDVVVQQLEEEYDQNEEYEEENEDYEEEPGLRNRFSSDTPDHGPVQTQRREEFAPTTRGKGDNYDDVTELKAKKSGVVSRTWSSILWILKLIVKLVFLWLLVCAVYYVYTNHLASSDPIQEVQDAIQNAANEASDSIDLK